MLSRGSTAYHGYFSNLQHTRRVAALLVRMKASIDHVAYHSCICTWAWWKLTCLVCPPVDSQHAGQMVVKCQALLKDRHSSERLLRCWGGHAGLDLKATQASIIQLLQVPQALRFQACQSCICTCIQLSLAPSMWRGPLNTLLTTGGFLAGPLEGLVC